VVGGFLVLPLLLPHPHLLQGVAFLVALQRLPQRLQQLVVACLVVVQRQRQHLQQRLQQEEVACLAVVQRQRQHLVAWHHLQQRLQQEEVACLAVVQQQRLRQRLQQEEVACLVVGQQQRLHLVAWQQRRRHQPLVRLLSRGHLVRIRERWEGWQI